MDIRCASCGSRWTQVENLRILKSFKARGLQPRLVNVGPFRRHSGGGGALTFGSGRPRDLCFPRGGNVCAGKQQRGFTGAENQHVFIISCTEDTPGITSCLISEVFLKQKMLFLPKLQKNRLFIFSSVLN